MRLSQAMSPLAKQTALVYYNWMDNVLYLHEWLILLLMSGGDVSHAKDCDKQKILLDFFILAHDLQIAKRVILTR
jgi:hypothetical protein